VLGRDRRVSDSTARASKTIVVTTDEPSHPTSVREASAQSTGIVHPEHPMRSRRESLREYWGDQWPRIEEALTNQGVDLEEPFEFVPWAIASEKLAESVPLNESARKGAVQNMVSWYSEEVTNEDAKSLSEWLSRKFGLGKDPSPEILQDIQVTAAPYNETLRGLGEQYADLVESYLLERWARGDFVKAPFASYGVSADRGFYSMSAAASGWSIVITLKEEDCPDVAGLRAQAKQVRKDRDAAIRSFLKR